MKTDIKTFIKSSYFKKVALMSLFCLVVMVLRILPYARMPKYWFDETFTIHAIRQPFGEMLKITSQDVHPPLYYICVKLFVMLLGEKNLVLHLVSLICFFLLLVSTIVFCTKYVNDWAAGLTVLAFLATPNMQKYALEVRMYSMAMLWIMLSFYIAYVVTLKFDAKKFNKYWIFLAITGAAGAYTHYFAGVAVVGVCIFLLIFLLVKYKTWKPILKQWIGCCGLMAVLYLPWMFVLVRQMKSISGNYWIDPLRLDLFETYWDMVFATHSAWTTGALIALFFIGIALLLYRSIRKKESAYIWVCGSLVVVLLWALFGIGYSVLETPILIDRYLSMMLPLLWLPVAVGISGLRNKIPYIVMVVAMCFSFYYTNAEVDSYYRGSDDEMLKVFLENHLKDGDSLFHIRVIELALCKVYVPDATHYVFEGIDDAEAFKGWVELTGCSTIQELSDLLDVEGDIWCISQDFYPLFEEIGFQTEMYQVGDRIVCRFYR